MVQVYQSGSLVGFLTKRNDMNVTLPGDIQIIDLGSTTHLDGSEFLDDQCRGTTRRHGRDAACAG